MSESGNGVDYLGHPLPTGYKRWFCGLCTAGCNFEAMTQCAEAQEGDCGFDRDQPISNGGPFAFIIPTGQTPYDFSTKS